MSETHRPWPPAFGGFSLPVTLRLCEGTGGLTTGAWRGVRGVQPHPRHWGQSGVSFGLS